MNESPKVICPLMSMNGHGMVHCCGECCAWWNGNACAVTSIAAALPKIDSSITSVQNALYDTGLKQ